MIPPHHNSLSGRLARPTLLLALVVVPLRPVIAQVKFQYAFCSIRANNTMYYSQIFTHPNPGDEKFVVDMLSSESLSPYAKSFIAHIKGIDRNAASYGQAPTCNYQPTIALAQTAWNYRNGMDTYVITSWTPSGGSQPAVQPPPTPPKPRTIEDRMRISSAQAQRDRALADALKARKRYNCGGKGPTACRAKRM